MHSLSRFPCFISSRKPLFARRHLRSTALASSFPTNTTASHKISYHSCEKMLSNCWKPSPVMHNAEHKNNSVQRILRRTHTCCSGNARKQHQNKAGTSRHHVGFHVAVLTRTNWVFKKGEVHAHQTGPLKSGHLVNTYHFWFVLILDYLLLGQPAERALYLRNMSFFHSEFHIPQHKLLCNF